MLIKNYFLSLRARARIDVSYLFTIYKWQSYDYDEHKNTIYGWQQSCTSSRYQKYTSECVGELNYEENLALPRFPGLSIRQELERDS